MKKFCYAVAGINGYGISSSHKMYEKNAQIYIKYSECKRFTSREAAGKYAVNRFIELNSHYNKTYNLVEHGDLKVDNLIFKKNLPILHKPICR